MARRLEAHKAGSVFLTDADSLLWYLSALGGAEVHPAIYDLQHKTGGSVFNQDHIRNSCAWQHLCPVPSSPGSLVFSLAGSRDIQHVAVNGTSDAHETFHLGSHAGDCRCIPESITLNILTAMLIMAGKTCFLGKVFKLVQCTKEMDHSAVLRPFRYGQLIRSKISLQSASDQSVIT